FNHRGFLLGRQRIEIELLARADPESSQLLTGSYFLGSGGSELERKIEIVEEVRLHELTVDLREVDGRSRRGRGLLEKGRKGLRFVTGLDLDHVRHVRRVEELGPEDSYRKLRRGIEHLLDTGGRVAFPVGPRDYVVSGLRTRGGGAGGAVFGGC